MRLLTRVVSGALAPFFVLALAASASAQDAKSVPLAKQLAAAMDAGKLDAIAAQDPSAPDVFVGALYFPGGQLLVVSAKYTAPQLLVDRLAKKEFRDIYIDLNSASVPESKVFIEDSAADGLRARKPDNQGADSYELAGKRMLFDGDWKKQKLSEQEYMKAFSDADERYAAALTALLAQLKKMS